MLRINDEAGASIAIAAPLPGERERPCELVTAPIETEHVQQLDALLALARDLNFKAPREGATHLHFDAAAMTSAHAIANLVNLLWDYGPVLKTLVGTNPNCLRLGGWPDSLIKAVNQSGFRRLSWPEVQTKLLALELTKYCDFNLVNCLRGFQYKNTIEVRILPVWLKAEPIILAAELFAAVLELASSATVIETNGVQKFSSEHVTTLLDLLPLSATQRQHCLAVSASSGKPPVRGFQAVKQ